MDFCQTEWMFLDLTILASFLHFYYCMAISGHISIPKFMAMTVLPQILLDSPKVNTTKVDAQCLKRKKERKLLYYY